MRKFNEESCFIPDPEDGMSTEEKNAYLSNKLATSPYRKMNIVRIERKEIRYTGWLIVHR